MRLKDLTYDSKPKLFLLTSYRRKNDQNETFHG